ncbi:MAG: ABC transporter permease [Treponemataceae bacterium]
MKHKPGSFALKYLFPIVAVVLFYELLRFIAGPRLFPDLTLVVARFAALIQNGKLPYHALVSARRIVIGLTLSVVVAVPVSGLLARFPKLDKALSPLLFLAFPIPKVTFLPVLLLLLGLGDASKIGMIFLIVVFQTIVSLRDVFRTLDRRAFQAVQAFGGGRRDLLRHVVIPASLPALLSALRISGGTAVAVLFIAESFATEAGMGYFIMDAWSRVSYADMHCGIATLSLIGLGLFALIDFAERKLCPWLKSNRIDE